MTQKLFTTFLIWMISLGFLFGQDQHFTQFYASPLTLNPALTGSFPGKYRLNMIYRDQGRSSLDVPFTTYSASGDLRFGVNSFRKTKGDAAGVGFVFFNDKSSSVNFFTNYMAVTGAFHKSLSKEGDHLISLGFQAGIAQRNVNYDNFTFDDQFNGTNGYTDPTNEFLPENNFSYGDYAVGLHYSYAPEKGIGVFVGGALHHILEPDISFYAREPVEDNQQESNLYQKYTAHVGLRIPIADQIELYPRALGYLQGPHTNFNAGTNLRIVVDNFNGTALQIGGWVRVTNNDIDVYTSDAIIGLVGLEVNKFLLGFSYDAKLSQLNNGQGLRGAFELSLTFLGEYENDGVMCPSF